MFHQEFFTSLLEALTANLLRTVLAMLGITIGIAAVIALVSLGDSSKKKVEAQIQSLGTNLVTISTKGTSSQLNLADAQAVSSLTGVKAVSPEYVGSGTMVHGVKTAKVEVKGITESYLGVRNLVIEIGHFFSDLDELESNNVVVLGAGVVSDLSETAQNMIGKKVVVDSHVFTVIGVTKAKGGNGFFHPDNTIYIPLSTAQKKLYGGTQVKIIAAQAVDQSSVERLKNQVHDLLLTRHNIQDSSKADFRVQTNQEFLETATKVTQAFSTLLSSIAGISLIVGGIGIMNVMLINVIERTREIGLRKALGATNSSIVAQFLGEAIILTSLGGAAGVFCGFFTSFIFIYFSQQPFAFSLASVFIALSISSIVGVVFGFYPAWKAAQLTPVDALRYE